MKHPEILIREETLEASFQAFCRDESIDAIAGLRSQQNSDLEVYTPVVKWIRFNRIVWIFPDVFLY